MKKNKPLELKTYEFRPTPKVIKKKFTGKPIWAWAKLKDE